MPLYDPALPITGYQSIQAGVIPADVFGVAINWFINRTPLTSRLPKRPTGAFSFLLTNDNYRSRAQNISVALTDAVGTTATFVDSTMYAYGDVLEIENEQILITATPTPTTATIVRGFAGTTGAAHVINTPAYLIGRTATGADVNTAGLSKIPLVTTQFVQTIQHPYQVGGGIEASDNYVSGFTGPLQRDRLMAIQHCMDDFEGSMYYGVGQAQSATIKHQQMKGLRALIVTNKTTAPAEAGAYKPTSLVRDTLQKCMDNGGNPTLMLVSTDFMTGLTIWGQTIQRLDAGENAFGVPIDLFYAPFLGGISFLPSPLLRPGTAICLSLPEVGIRMRRNLFEKPRGSRGDAFEGDFIMDGAIELQNEAHHAWVSGITTFAAA